MVDLKTNNVMKVYVLLLWFLEGDCELVDSFKGVFSSYDRAVKEKNDIDKMDCEIVSSTEAEAREYKHKMYGDPSYYEIRECDVVGQSKELCQCGNKESRKSYTEKQMDAAYDKGFKDAIRTHDVVGQSEELCECMPDPKCRIENNTVVCNGCNKERR